MKVDASVLINKMLHIVLPKSTQGRWFKFVNIIPKRVRIIAVTIVMLALMTLSTFFSFGDSWLIFIIIIALVSYLTTYIAVFEGIDGVEWLMLFIMPIIFAISIYLFYSLLPVRWLTRIPFLGLFALGYYSILLTQNILNVGVEKSIQLYRAAFSVNYLIQTMIIFLFSMVLFSFRLNFLLNALLSIGIIFISSLQLFWSVNLEKNITRNLLSLAGANSIIMAELIILSSFVPLSINIAALTVTAGYYGTSGILQNYIGERLFKNVIREYSFVLLFVLFVIILTLQW